MPSHMPSSFAAAAGQGSSRDSRNGRGDGRPNTDWVRKDSRTANGTVTLRRSSTNPIGQNLAQGDAPLPTPTSELPSASYEQSTDSRYSKSFLLDLYKGQQESGASNGDISHLYANGWSPGQSNGSSGRSGWGKSSDNRESHAPDVCWDTNGEVQPIGLEEMSEQEKTLFAGDVNSPLKPPPQSSNKDGNPQGFGSNGRKTSVSQGSSAFGLSSPASSRPSTRRQQTADSVTGLASPGGTSRFPREEPSPFFTRKFDSKDGDDRVEEPKPALPFGGLMRANTAGSALGNGPASPWGPSGANMSPMGTFGSFAFSNSANPPTPIDKRPTFGRGESRFAQLMSKESTEDMSKPAERAWRPRQRTDTDPFADEPPAGSAALGGDDGGHDNRRSQGLDTPARGTSGDFGMADAPGFRDAFQRGQSHQTPQTAHGQPEPLSPSDTNPYRSPPDDRHDADDESYDEESGSHSRMQGLGGIPEHGQNTYGTLPRGFPGGGFDGSDRSQTSSVSGNKGHPQLGGGLLSLGGISGMGGWPTTGNPIGTPDREHRSAFPSAFGSSLFGPMGDLQSPSLGGLGGGMFGSNSAGNISGTSTLGRGSKLGSLFPAAMQAQMQATENEHPGEGEQRQNSAFGAIGRNAFPSRETDSPMRTGRHPFEDLFPQSSSQSAQPTASTSESAAGQTATSFGQAQPNYQQSQASSDSASNQLPTAQQRMMVMPDRMRWVYLDPQGQVQGPFSGLEMHDWYKASFFTPDLSVKKLEDSDFEPLGQLIRRIGNSREPFLVPQIGIPHGQPSTQAGSAFTPPVAGHGAAGAQPGAVQPPFANSFPSFGTTLTAEQQNNLERRKQEEQYLMARQREFLAQQQVNMKQMQMGGLPAVLHHHSSAHSLQSQPSFGSISSPIGMPPQPPMPAVPGFFDGPPRQVPSQGAMHPDFFREEELARLSLRDRHQLFNTTAPAPQPTHSQQINPLFGQPDMQNQGQRMEDVDFDARLQEFNNLRAQHDAEEAAQAAQAQASSDPIAPPQPQQQLYEEPQKPKQEVEPEPQAPETLSLTQRVQKAASAKQSPNTTVQPESPWAKVNPNLPMPFPPPPQSTTPLPAPTARRNQSNLPEALNVEARSRSETPEVASATPSIAPWAKEPTEAPKALSLKEIQEAEAKKAAKAEEIAAAARRANYEQELKLLAAQPAAPAPGLPTTSTWGNSSSPATPIGAPSAWAKPTAAKSQAASKKTLADIQRDEELRKAKLAAASVTTQTTQGITGGKRYADLASKPNAPVASAGPAWSTVGAGGKVKIPTAPAAAPPQALRSVSTATIAPVSSSRVARPTPAVRSVTTSGPSSVNSAKEEFTKWAKATLEKGLNSGINVNDFVAMLQAFPPEASIIADSVYSNSQTMHGNEFAAEFIRRRNNAEKGIVEPTNSGSGTAFSSASDKSGGWSEVAKKGPPKEEPTAGFKVVPNKKKGKK